MTTQNYNTITRDLVLSDDEEAEIIFKALGNSSRLRILNALGMRTMTVAEITEILGAPASTANQHIKVLEEAGLIESDLRPATRVTEKICRAVYKKIVLDMNTQPQSQERSVEISMPIGGYSEFEVSRPCGLASQDALIGIMGDTEAFLEPNRVDAQLIWFATGYIEYRFPKRLPPRSYLENLYLSMEICSEAPGYNNDWPSDITLWINNVEIGTWTSLADSGGERGLLNPDWWGMSNTQYGVLKSWQVNGAGSYIDGIKISDVSMSDLAIDDYNYISVKIGIKEDAEYQGGLNLFGRYFGNYPQDLVLRLIYGKL